MSSSSELYTTIQSTARAFVLAQSPDPAGSNAVSSKPSPCTDDCLTSFGPSFLVSVRPPLQGSRTHTQFLEHMRTMTPMLETWSVEVERVLVDEQQRQVVVWAMYYMVPKGEGSAESRTVKHEVMWWLKMTEDGKLVQRATEYVDGAAAGRIQELIGVYKKSVGA